MLVPSRMASAESENFSTLADVASFVGNFVGFSSLRSKV